MQDFLVVAEAWLEIAAGLSLGLTCLLSKMKGAQRSAALGLFIFNSEIVLLFGWAGITTKFRGVLLWPFAVLHAVIVVALLWQLFTIKTLAHSKNWQVANPTFQQRREGEE